MVRLSDQDIHEWEKSFGIQSFSDFQLSTAEDVADKIRDIAKARIVSAEIEYESPFLPTQKIENQEIDNSVYCPSCGSSHLQLRRDTNVSWGRAAVGWAFLGLSVVPLVLLQVKIEIRFACLNLWHDMESRRFTQDKRNHQRTNRQKFGFIKNQRNRNYMNSFIAEVGPYLEEISKVETRPEKLSKKVNQKENQNTANGCAYGCILH
jgi:hypothetical protein